MLAARDKQSWLWVRALVILKKKKKNPKHFFTRVFKKTCSPNVHFSFNVYLDQAVRKQAPYFFLDGSEDLFLNKHPPLSILPSSAPPATPK